MKKNAAKTIRLQNDPKTGELFFDLKELENVINIKKVDSYTLLENSDESLTLKFYDKKGNLITPKK